MANNVSPKSMCLSFSILSSRRISTQASEQSAVAQRAEAAETELRDTTARLTMLSERVG